MNKEFIKKYLEETQEIAEKIDVEEINKFIEILFQAWKDEKKIITMGNGGSASTASHFSGDLSKTVVSPSSEKELVTHKKGFKALCLNDNPALLTAWINDCGWENAYAGALNTILEEGDVVLLVSVHGGSGWSGNLVEAMKMARRRKAKIIGMAGFDGGKIKEIGDCCIVVPKNSTPHTEGFHGVLQHMIVERLQQIISIFLKDSIVEKLKEMGEKYEDSSIKQNFSKLIEDYS